MPKKKLMLIDGNSLLFRAFYALPLLHNREGVYTNGVYGFLTMFNRVTASEQPSHIVVAFDMDRKPSAVIYMTHTRLTVQLRRRNYRDSVNFYAVCLLL